MVIATAKPANKLGAKHRCGGCRKSFYDLGREAPSCPRCSWNPEPVQQERVVELTVAELRAVEEEDRRARMLGGLTGEQRTVAQQSGKTHIEFDDIEDRDPTSAKASLTDGDDDGDDEHDD
jgi:hypothetical protein